MNRKIAVAAGLATVAALSLTACSGGAETPTESTGPVTLTVSGWALDTTPDFQLLADAFEDEYPDVTVELREYDPTDYNTLITADLAGGSAPDIITQKEVKFVTTFQEGGQLLDVSDIELPEGLSGVDSYTIDGTLYAVPFRQDHWVTFYNKDLFAQAGVAEPDGTWTWEDYDAAAEELTAALGGAKGSYMHRWQSVVQGFANAQEDADLFAGDYSYMAPYYERVLALQDAGAQVDFNTSTANQLTYQGEFGTQKAAMLPMGTWYLATLMSQQASGEAQDFEWGIAPIPQLTEATTGLDETPVTFGDPAGFAINANIDDAKLQAAKDFLAFAGSEKAAEALAAVGLTPALTTVSAAETLFSLDGAPTDDLSKFAWSTHDTRPENPTNSKTAAIQGILGDMHTAIMSGSQSVDSAISDANERVANEVGID